MPRRICRHSLLVTPLRRGRTVACPSAAVESRIHRTSPTLPAAADDDSPVRAGRHRRGRRGAAGQRTPRARPSWSRRRESWTPCSCGRSGPATTRCCRISRARGGDRGPERRGRRSALHYFLINKGPWSRLDHNQPFVPGAPAEAGAANFYPADATKDEVQKWIDSLSGDAQGGRHRILHDDPPRPTASSSSVPYSVEYQGELARAADAAARSGGADRSRR